MKLIIHQSKSNHSTSNSFILPRWVYDCDTHIHKIIPNGTSAKFTTEEISKNADIINKSLGFKYFKNVYCNDQYIYMDMHKLENANYNYDVEADVYSLIDIWIDTNLKVFPLCNVDMTNLNIMLYKDKPVLIDWDDALQGNKHTAFYIVAELFHFLSMMVINYSFANKQKATEYMQHKIQSTCLEINIEQWNWIINNCHPSGYNFEEVLHWSEIPGSWLLRKD